MNLGILGPTCAYCGGNKDHGDERPCTRPPTKVDYVSLQDFEVAVSTLRRCALGTLPIGEAWLTRAAEHLVVKVDLYFRDRPPIRDEKQFMAMLKTMAQGYREGAQALEWAARRLKDTHHDAHGANETHKAAITMARAAQELIGEE